MKQITIVTPKKLSKRMIEKYTLYDEQQVTLHGYSIKNGVLKSTSPGKPIDVYIYHTSNSSILDVKGDSSALINGEVAYTLQSRETWKYVALTTIIVLSLLAALSGFSIDQAVIQTIRLIWLVTTEKTQKVIM